MASDITSTCINSNNKPSANFLGVSSAGCSCEREKGNVMPKSIEDVYACVEVRTVESLKSKQTLLSIPVPLGHELEAEWQAEIQLICHARPPKVVRL